MPEMRLILIFVLLLGLGTIVLAILAGAGEAARWSNVYALFEQTGDKNPLQSKETRDRFDAIIMRGDPFSTALVFTGLLTCVAAIAGLVKATKIRDERPKT